LSPHFSFLSAHINRAVGGALKIPPLYRLTMSSTIPELGLPQLLAELQDHTPTVSERERDKDKESGAATPFFLLPDLAPGTTHHPP
jgi:hypothetical protein